MEKGASGGAGVNRGMAGILGGMARRGTELFTRRRRFCGSGPPVAAAEGCDRPVRPWRPQDR
ncbi:hypothetical protein EMIT0373P_50670 [Pseudomonas chlororaphis]